MQGAEHETHNHQPHDSSGSPVGHRTEAPACCAVHRAGDSLGTRGQRRPSSRAGNGTRETHHHPSSTCSGALRNGRALRVHQRRPHRACAVVAVCSWRTEGCLMADAISAQGGRQSDLTATRALRRLLIASAIALLVAGSLTSQTYESHLASSVSTRNQSTVPRHTCTPTLCIVDKAPNHVPGGWPYPYLPALLLATSFLCGFAATRLRETSRLIGEHDC